MRRWMNAGLKAKLWALTSAVFIGELLYIFAVGVAAMIFVVMLIAFSPAWLLWRGNRWLTDKIIETNKTQRSTYGTKRVQ